MQLGQMGAIIGQMGAAWSNGLLSIFLRYTSVIQDFLFLFLLFHQCFHPIWQYKMFCAHFVYSQPLQILVVSPISHGFFYWQVMLETKICELGVLVASGMQVGSASWHSNKKCVWVHILLNISMYKQLYLK